MGRPKTDFASYPIPPLPDLGVVRIRHCEQYPGYAVDELGRIWSCKIQRCNGFGEWHLISLTKTNRGYLRATIRHGSFRKVRLVHQLVAMAFYGPTPDGMEIMHLDGNPSNANLSNLKHGTHSENMKDAIRHGSLKAPLNRHLLARLKNAS
jgi:hypothetical protein